MCDFGWNGIGWIAVVLCVIALCRTVDGGGCGCQNESGNTGCGGCLGGCGGCR